MASYLEAAAKKGGNYNTKPDDDIYTVTAENRKRLVDEPAKVAGK